MKSIIEKRRPGGSGGSSAIARACNCERLETRQMLSLTVDIRAADGSKTIDVSSVGQVIQLEAWAVVSGKNGDVNQDGVGLVAGSFIGSGYSSGSIGGNLTAVNLAPFTAAGSASGQIRDLNGDGNLDVGSNPQSNGSDGYFFARAFPQATAGTPGAIAVNGSLELEIAQLTYTVTQLNSGGETDITFQPWQVPGASSAVWTEDNTGHNSAETLAAPLVLIDPSLAPVPHASNTTAYVLKNTSATVQPLAYDTSAASLNPASFIFTTTTAHGSATLQPDGSVLYTPNSGFTGMDSFSYTVTDAEGHVSNIATVSLDVVTTAPPVAADVTVTAPLNGSVAVNVLSSATAATGLTVKPSSVSVVTAPQAGTAQVQPDGTILYTPRRGFLAPDTFSYTVTDSLGHISNVATVSVSMTLEPRPVAGLIETAAQSGATTDFNILAVASASDGLTIDPTSIVISYHPPHGAAVPLANGTIAYTPTAGYIGPDELQYEVSDSNGVQSSFGEIDLNVEGAQPVARNFTVNVQANRGQNIALGTDIFSSFGAQLNNSTLSAVLESPALGKVGVWPGYVYPFTLSYGSSSPTGTDTIAYTISDTSGQSATGYITVNLQPGPPQVQNISSSVTVGGSVDINVLAGAVSGGAAIVPGTVSILTPPLNGSAVVQADGTVLYTPAVDNPSADSFIYEVKDASGLVSNTAEVSIVINSNQLNGRVIGTSGSYRNQGNTIGNVFDGNINTFFDGPTANGNWVGLDLGSTCSISQIIYAPRSGWAQRMVGGQFQASNDINFKVGVVSLAIITATPITGGYTTVQVSIPGAYRYVRYLSPNGSYGNISQLQFLGNPVIATAPTQLTGTVIGTTGSYQNQGNGIANVFDGNLSTFFDAPTASGSWAGLDLGTAQTISQISFAPRSGFAYRLLGGMFQASNTADFSSGVVTLYTATTKPPSNQLTTVSVNAPGSYRYVRYIGPDNACCDIAEAVFYG